MFEAKLYIREPEGNQKDWSVCLLEHGFSMCVYMSIFEIKGGRESERGENKGERERGGDCALATANTKKEITQTLGETTT